MRTSILAACLAAALTSCLTGDQTGGAEADGALVRDVRALAPVSLPWNVRLSVPTSLTRCSPADSFAPADLACEAGRLEERVAASLAAVAGRAAATLASGVDADAMHAAALVDLLADGTAGNTLDRSVSYLEMITRLAPRRASAWTDLSATYLMRAGARQDGRALVAALDAATRALEIDTASAPASYNRAVALDLLAMDVEATREWHRFLRLEPRSPWSAFAKGRAGICGVGVPGRPAPDGPADTLRAFVRRDAFDARMFAWEVLLGQWGTEYLAGNLATADARLAAAAIVAGESAGRFGDSSLTSAVRAIETARGDTARSRALAGAHVAYARGRDSTIANRHREAERDFASVLATPGISPVLRDWAQLSHANSTLFLLQPREATLAVRHLLARLDKEAHPSLAGRAHWMLAVIAFREGRDIEGIEAMTRARALFERAGEVDNHAATTSLAGERALRLGLDDGFAETVEALRRLRPYRSGIWRHNALYILVTNATRLGLDRAAMTLVDEGAAVAAGTRTVALTEMRLVRARALWEAGDMERAGEALAIAAGAIDSMPPGTTRDAFRAELALTLASGPLASTGARAYAMLDTVVKFHERSGRATRLIPAWVARARVGLALGVADSAEADLGRATRLYALQGDSLTNLPERAALLERARGVFDQLAMTRLARGDASGALEALERGRASFVAPSRPTSASTGIDGMALDLALVGDTLLAWVIDPAGVTVERATVPGDSVRVVIERVRVAMELRTPGASVRPHLARLYDWLVRPVAARLGTDSTTLAIVSDGALAEVPFAALLDSATGRYFVESRPLRWAPTLRDARQRRSRALGGVSLIVSAPELDRGAFPSLAALPGAGRETRTVASRVVRPLVLSGREADSSSIVAALPSAAHFHFAGHAVFDDARPNRSRLAVMPRGIDAASIARLDLGGLRLAVLSACETMRAPGVRGTGFTGLTEAFLAAGAGGVLGSLWRVDDEATATLMDAFYRVHEATRDPAVSLREAQLQLIRGPAGPSRDPAAWGAFRLAGR